MKYDLIIFDLDGTTLNTLSDLAAACSAALTANGFPPRTVEEVRLFVGSGLAKLVKRAVPENTSDAVCEKVLSDLKAYYADHVNVETAPYPGIIETIRHLRSAGIRVAVNSNKVDSAVQSLCRIYFDGLTDFVLGERPDIERKPSPQGVFKITSALGISPERTLYVGDSNIDLLTAQNAKIDVAWVSWGFRRRNELGDLSVPLAFDNAGDLEKYILAD